MTLKQIEYYEAVCQTGNVTAAAQQLYVSRSVISRALQELEEELGIRLFLRSPGKVYSREELMSEVWGEEYFGESRTVDMHIKTLRQKLGPGSGCIKTVVGIGYRMEATP